MSSPVMTKRTAIACLFGTAALLQPAHGRSQDEDAVWTTHAELREWIPPQEDGLPVVEDRTEGGRAYLRLAPPWFWVVTHERVPRYLAPTEYEPLLDPRVHNAVRLTLRHTLAIDFVSGLWTHAGIEYDESMIDVPHFDTHVVPGDGEWYQVTLRFSESPFVDWERGVAFLWLGPMYSPREQAKREALGQAVTSQDEAAFMDIDRIEFLHVEETLEPPVITGFSPARGETGAIVEITGSGFAEPAKRNIVLFDGDEAEILGGDATVLTARAPPALTGPIEVRNAGGQAVSDAPFKALFPPSRLRVVSGDGQVAPIETELEPLVPELVDRHGEGLPGHTVTFEVTSGAGTLSVSEAETDDAGRASTVLTLGSSPGVTKVTVRTPGVVDAVFTATATE